ncbi:periplasmic serine protease [Candidatus Scalindua japonica]|uniref:Periplasmic serine protease n=1 Tax=Candidatus Scalindua japonica TaxID=1284222 RepID=A0A286TY16_9BACT|nr:signal peptide peptidase SppA [Candidatus Scalindua japonica]GAX60783.1 periplasmic serine protease [Candidatus Scalindua japonica]
MDDNKKKSRTGFWISTSLAIFFFLCCVVLFISLIGLFVLKGAITTQVEDKSTKKLAETIIGGTGTDKILLIPLKGVITGQSSKKLFQETPSIVDSVKHQLEQARNDNNIKAVILEINSPGGGITASDIIYKEILEFKEETNKKVIVSMQDVAASGAYYISAAADKIISHPTTITGSIGVIMPLINFANLAEKYGIEDNSIKSGDMKSIGSPLNKMSDAEKKVLYDIVDEMYTRFVNIIAVGRNMEIEDVRKLADGRIYTGKQALDNGLVDHLGYVNDAITLTKEITGLKDAKIIRYKRMFNLADVFTGSMDRLLCNPTIKFSLNVSTENDSPGFMYLWTGYQQNYLFKWPTFN